MAVETPTVTIRIPKVLLVALAVIAIPASAIGGYFYGRSTRDLNTASRKGYERGNAAGKREQRQACRPLLDVEAVTYMQGYLAGKADLPRRKPTKVPTRGDC